jgi:hypothetical protein
VIARALAAALSIAALAPCRALAEPAAVQIVVAGPDDDVAAEMGQVLLDALRFEPLSPTVVRRASIDPREVVTPVPLSPTSVATLARVWIDLTGPAQCMVFIADATWERVLVRRVVLAGPIDAVTREEIVQIVTASLDALLAGEAVGVTRPEAAALLGVESGRAELPPPPLVGLGPGRIGLELGFGYEVAPWSSSVAPPHGLAVSAALVLRRIRLRPAIGLTLATHLGTDLEGGDVTARIEELPLALTAAVEAFRRQRVSLRAGVAAGVMVVRVEPSLRRDGTGLTLRESHTLAAAELRGGLELRVALAGSLALSLGVEVEAQVPAARYVIERPAGDEVVFEPWVVRPLLRLAISGEPI